MQSKNPCCFCGKERPQLAERGRVSDHQCKGEDIQLYAEKQGIQKWAEGVNMREERGSRRRLDGYFIIMDTDSVPSPEVFVEAKNADDAVRIAKINTKVDKVVCIRAAMDDV